MKWLYICTVNCKYEVVRRVSKRLNFKEVSEDEEWNLYWTDYSVALERVMEMKKYQKINHFPGMSEICRKDLLSRNLNRMVKLFPKDYNIFPRSWCLPADYGDFQAFARQKKSKTYILKPESGCQGKGIWVTKNPKEIKPNEHMVCQQYISRPFLIDGFKFDLRVYTLVTSCDPFRIFVFKDGLARFATTKYTEPHGNNVDNVYMHLTNYAINKHSEDFIRDDEEGGSKRRIITMNKWLTHHGYNVEKMWNDIDDVLIKTLISAHPILKHNYRTCFPNHVKGSACFEILGMDVLLDRKLKPYILEVNHSPSFHTDAKLDKEIKEALIYDSLNLINCGAVDKRKCIEEERRRIKERLFQRQGYKKESKEELEQAQQEWLESLTKYEDQHLGNFRRIYPAHGTDKYDKYFQHSAGSLFQETAAFKARSECARQQREEILRKKEKMEMMLNKNKKAARPESPGSRKRRLKRPSVPRRQLASSRQGAEGTEHVNIESELIDTTKPLDILEEEELERISGLLQRDNLVRGLGIVEHVYRLLHCTPGTMGVMKSNDPRQQFGINNLQKYSAYREVLSASRYRQRGLDNRLYIFDDSKADKLTINFGTSSLGNEVKELAPVGSEVFKPTKHLPLRVKDLENTLTGGSSTTSVMSSATVSVPAPPGQQNADQNTGQQTENDIENDKEESYVATSIAAVSQEHDDFVTRASHLQESPLAAFNHNPYTPAFGTLQTFSGRPLQHPMQGIITQPGSVTQWQIPRGRNTSLGQLSDTRGVPLQRAKIQNKKPIGSGYGSSYSNSTSGVYSDSDYKYSPETDPRGLMRGPYSDLTQRRTLSAATTHSSHASTRKDAVLLQSYRVRERAINPSFKGGAEPMLMGLPLQPQPPMGLPSAFSFPGTSRVTPYAGPQGLSVVSAPAPVVQRPELTGNRAQKTLTAQQNVDSVPGRSTRSQRIRGASNNMRLKQMEMRENHAIVYS
ncbi:tubulin polyglutamylase TTLL13P-like [Lingula anatina]|uniref:Tubulin polyglutamylase TTLL13P-like n=1 Tax=Lingula anatina TaxID=7574 RepID=A0A1S3J6P2_LINAN|nr:tubulin polyglutamylase TTLL13P-like [Lingula anatina]|eukprot:XP_013405921.1 tubulin polyglutamylase TTLL13P-like [Lingula anatina]